MVLVGKCKYIGFIAVYGEKKTVASFVVVYIIFVSVMAMVNKTLQFLF